MDQSVPVGYQVPPFPSLHWPYGDSKVPYDRAFLYYGGDVLRFTLWWCLIMMAGLYTASAGIILVTYVMGSRNYMHKSPTASEQSTAYSGRIQQLRSRMAKSSIKFVIPTVLIYIIMGVLEACMASSLLSLLVSAIYRSAQLRMTVWLPFIFALIVSIYNISSAYSLTGVIM